jgi:hypothetical protein
MCDDCKTEFGVESVCLDEGARDELLDHFRSREWGLVRTVTGATMLALGHPVTDEALTQVTAQIEAAALEQTGDHIKASGGEVETLGSAQILDIVTMTLRTL